MWVAAMAPLLIFAALAGWLWRQFTGARSAKWSRRWLEWYAPFGKRLVADVRAVGNAVWGHFTWRRAAASAANGGMDAELRDLLGG